MDELITAPIEVPYLIPITWPSTVMAELPSFADAMICDCHGDLWLAHDLWSDGRSLFCPMTPTEGIL